MNNFNSNAMNPITEDDIANYLSNTPDFFERHAQLLGQVQLTSPHGNRAVSLQERQAEMLREKIKALEHRVMDMVRHGTENVVTADRLQRWTRGLLTTRDPRLLPAQIAGQLQSLFLVPQTAIKVWDCDSAYQAEPYAQWVSDDVKALATSLTAPYCGLNSGFEAAGWLAEPQAAVSIALIPLRPEPEAAAFGLLVLASPDAQRYNAEMGTDFLERIAELASGALSRLRP
ncbi:DUF484 family protein [Variovorax saccharolyticus]|uniref:DUF484 family protein n=1 Tax=Variovorax saccharolyticus TaxID=3053516 RepID=UPI0025753215|nr:MULTISPECIES: DUF484 family protein [unclassified Variovorax]MDM0017705.1 DUF484 family protein [Variovorax sp. J22R187]MDM0024677.1 DUF484 family protein [Variovorax sp. J31P216]